MHAASAWLKPCPDDALQQQEKCYSIPSKPGSGDFPPYLSVESNRSLPKTRSGMKNYGFEFCIGRGADVTVCGAEARSGICYDTPCSRIKTGTRLPFGRCIPVTQTLKRRARNGFTPVDARNHAEVHRPFVNWSKGYIKKALTHIGCACAIERC